MQAHDNLYLVSEAYEISLVEHLPYLIEQNRHNELVSILIIHDLLKILKHIYLQETMHSESTVSTFNKWYDYKENGSYVQPLANKIPLAFQFDPRTFYFKNGRLKYCPALVSPCHNVLEN
jgi:hypothetical protein